MKTFSVVVDNLGPIKHASFEASHLNVVCGKNNTGKSFLLHAFYYFFSDWKYRIGFKPEDSHVNTLANEGVVNFSVDEYLPRLNDWVYNSMPKFIEKLPNYMRKNADAFRGCKIGLKIDDSYAEHTAKALYIHEDYEIVRGVSIKIDKESGSKEVRVELSNSNKGFPEQGIVARALRWAIGLSVVNVIPSPMLLTSERVGSMLYGADIYQYSLRTTQNRNAPSSQKMDKIEDRYPKSTFDELLTLNNMNRFISSESWFVKNDSNYKSVYKSFLESVVQGRYETSGEKIYYLEDNKDEDLKVDINETSSSVKSLVFMDYFMRNVMQPGALLMIDEPELNLHPEKQRFLTRILTRIVNTTGVGVVISTHSDYILREINALYRISNLNNTERINVANKHGIPTDALINQGDVSICIVRDGSADMLVADPRYGFAVSSFDDTIESFNMLYSDISNAMEESDAWSVGT